MRKCARGTMWLIAATLVAGNVHTALAEQERSGTRSARCLVRVMSDPDILPIGAGMIDSLLTSTPVLGEPAREILGVKGDTVEEVVEVSFEPLEDSESQLGFVLTGCIAVEVHDSGARPVAEEFLGEICERLERALQRVGQIDRGRLEERLDEVDEELQELNERYELLRAQQRELLERAGQDDLSRARIVDTINDLEDQSQVIELALAGTRAREAALTEQIAKIGQQAIEAGENSAVVDELREIVDIRKMELARVQKLVQTGQASESDLNGPREALARARAELARYRESVSNTAGAELLAQLNHELVSLGVDSAQQEAELVAVQKRLSAMRDRRVLELADRYEREVKLQLGLSERDLRGLAEEQYDLKQTIRNLRLPEVVVIGEQ